MPTFIRPARVVVDEGSGHVAAIIGAAALAAVVSGAAVLIADIVTALLITAAIAVAGALTGLVIVLRRTGLAVVQFHDAPVDPDPVPVITTAGGRAITPTRIVLHGQPLQHDPGAKGHRDPRVHRRATALHRPRSLGRLGDADRPE